MSPPAAEGSRDESYDLDRFVRAQDPVLPVVLAELKAGRKASHWMWFVFPQIAGLGSSPMASRYAIGTLAEAEAYLRHGVLGPRLLECTDLVTHIEGRSAGAIFGSPDDMKFRSSMTLFGRAAPAETAYRAALDTYFGGVEDPATLKILGL